MSFNLVCKIFVCLFPGSQQLFLGRDVTVRAPHTGFSYLVLRFLSQVSWTTHSSTTLAEFRSGCLRKVWGWLVLNRGEIQNITNSWTRLTVSLKSLLWPAQITQVLPSKLSIPIISWAFASEHSFRPSSAKTLFPSHPFSLCCSHRTHFQWCHWLQLPVNNCWKISPHWSS